MIKRNSCLVFLGLIILLSIISIGDTIWEQDIEIALETLSPASQTTAVADSIPGVVLRYAIDQIIDFDGSTVVDLGSVPELDGATTATWSLWVKPVALANNSTFIGKLKNNNSEYSWWLTIPTSGLGAGNDEVAFYFAPTSVAYTNTATGFLTNNTWYHLAVVYDGSQSANADKIQLFVNGVKRNLFIVGTIPSSIPSTASHVTLGSVSDSARFFTGSISDVRIYTRPLSISEVQSLSSIGPGTVSNFAENQEHLPDTSIPSTPSTPVIPATPSEATTQTYWVSPIGSATWTSCKRDTPLTGTAACSISLASKNAVAGDTIYIRGGTYVYTNAYSATIFPANSGTAAHPIVFQNYSNEEVILDGNNVKWAYGIYLINKEYIKVKGVAVKNFEYPFSLNGASHNELAYIKSPSILIQHNSTHNWVHDSVFSKSGSVLFKYPGLPLCSPQGLNMQVGDTSATWYKKDFSSYNLIENNTFYHGAHDNAEIRAPYNVIRNNYWHNEDWMETPAECGLKDVSGASITMSGNRLLADFGPLAYRNLYEGNRIGYSGIGVDYKQGGEGLELTGNRSIVRRNLVYKAKGAGIYPYNKNLGADLSAGNNYIYSNTVYKNGYDGMGAVNFAGIQFSGSFDNVIKNNIVFDNKEGPYSGSGSGKPGSANIVSSQVYDGNWTDSQGNPLFVNTTALDPFNSTLPDLRVRSGSPVIDSGVWLTTIVSPSGSGTTFRVADSNYFMDGWGVIEGDTIQFAGQAIAAKILAVNYETHTITVDRPMIWTVGQGVSLKYNGPKPDVGAYESLETGTGINIQNFTPGDFNSDGAVNTLDFSLMVAVWNQSSPIHDLNKDGMVNSLDFSILVQNWTR